MSTDASLSSRQAHLVPTNGVFVLPTVESNQSVVLYDLSWNEYVALRAKPANIGVRMTYDNRVLEITTLSDFHELISIIIDHFILEWRVAKNISSCPTGSMTMQRKMLSRGLESDQSYYIANELKVRGPEKIDLERVPPPDLAIEVEHTSLAIQKMPIYAALRVPEVWRFRDETLTAHCMNGDEYELCEVSAALPGFPLDSLRIALSQRHQMDETTLVANFRKSLTS